MTGTIDYIAKKASDIWEGIKKYKVAIAATVGFVAGSAAGLNAPRIPDSPKPIDPGARPVAALPSEDLNGDELGDLLILGGDKYQTVLYGRKEGGYTNGSALNIKAVVPIHYEEIEARVNAARGE